MINIKNDRYFRQRASSSVKYKFLVFKIIKLSSNTSTNLMISIYWICRAAGRGARPIGKTTMLFIIYLLRKSNMRKKAEMNSSDSTIFLIHFCSSNSSYQTFYFTNDLSHSVSELLFHSTSYAAFRVVKKNLVSKKQLSVSSSWYNHESMWDSHIILSFFEVDELLIAFYLRSWYLDWSSKISIF